MEMSKVRLNACTKTLLLFALSLTQLSAQQIDTARSVIRIHVGKSGLLSAAGHEHWVTARIARGELSAGSNPYVRFVVESGKMVVEPDEKLSASDQAEVQRTMQTKVLESDKYPEISFRSTNIRQTGPNAWDVAGNLALHGTDKPVHVSVKNDNGTYTGRAHIKQTEFGIQPVKVGGGLVRVKDELDIEFTIVPKTNQ